MIADSKGRGLFCSDCSANRRICSSKRSTCPAKSCPGCPRSQWGGTGRSPAANRAGRGNSVPGIGRFLLRFRPMTNRNTRSGKLAFLLIALIVLAGFQPGPAKTQDIEQLRKAAEQGDASAQYNLGLSYATGEGVPQDYQEAVKWFRLAAEQGNAESQDILGFMYAEGRGMPQDYQEAVKWFRLAAEQGNAGAQDKLGFMYVERPGRVPGLPRGHEVVSIGHRTGVR